MFLPTTLHIIVAAGGSLSGTWTITYDAMAGVWSDPFGPHGSCLLSRWALACGPPAGIWSFLPPGVTFPIAPSVAVCTPFALTFTAVDLTACGGLGAGAATVTVTQ